MSVTGVSIITCTNKPQFIKNIFQNFVNQSYKPKELILIINSNHISIEKCRKLSDKISNVSIFQLPEEKSLGHCLNFAIQKAKHDVVAKFDDDDFYAPGYIKEAILTMERSQADVVGKRTYFSYLMDKQLLIIRFPSRQNRSTDLVAGRTIVAKKSVCNHVKFPNCSLGEDVGFLRKCRERGLRIFSSSKYNYVYMRRSLPNHTLKVTDGYLLSKNCKIIGYTLHYKQLASGK